MAKSKPVSAKKVARKTATPKFIKSPGALVAVFAQIMECLPQAERRVMFSYPVAFTNGQMFTGLHGDRMFLRLSDADRKAFSQLPGALLFEIMPGRPMKEYVAFPAEMVKPGAEIEAWLQKSFEFARSLPPKPQKVRRRK